jgi:uncharacterized phiE125 gp8 family phage protein
MTEPVALADLKVHLRLSAGATSEDAYLTTMITAARRACELRINRSIVGSGQTLTIDKFPARDAIWPNDPLEPWAPGDLYIELPGGTVSSVTSISYLDEAGQAQTLSTDAYVTDLANTPARVAPLVKWPAVADRPGAVSIAYVISPMSSDDWTAIGQAMLLMIGHWYRNREAVSVDQRGVPTELPLSVSMLLEPLRQWATD